MATVDLRRYHVFLKCVIYMYKILVISSLCVIYVHVPGVFGWFEFLRGIMIFRCPHNLLENFT